MRKYLVRLGAAAVLATTIFAGGSGPADAAPVSHLNNPTVSINNVDTGWGG
jgi:hypothetical protein